MARQSAQGLEDVDERLDGDAADAAGEFDDAEVDSAFDLDPTSPEAEALGAATVDSDGDDDAEMPDTGTAATETDTGAEGQDATPSDDADEEEAAAPSMFQLEDDLVESATRLVEERARFEQLLASAREGRDRVSPEIYERVVGDYQGRLETVEEEYAPIRDEILTHVRGVMQEERTVRQRLEEINEVVEELRFRRQLGEFDDEEFDRRRQESTGELTELDEKLSCIESLYRTVRSLLGHDAQAVLQSPRGVSPLSAEEATVARQDNDAGASASPSDAPGRDPALDQTAVMQAIPNESSQSQTVIVAAPGGPYLENVQPAGRSGRVMITPLTSDLEGPVALLERELVLGRSTTCDIVLQGATVSRRHALIRRNGEKLEVEDISSGGGVLVNGQRIERLATVTAGDQLQIGTAVLRVDA